MRQYTPIYSAETTLTQMQVVNREVDIRSGIQLVSENVFPSNFQGFFADAMGFDDCR